MPWITVRYNRHQLYEEVWTEAVTKVARRYKMSDVGLRKVCKKLNVPLPALGYWAKLQHGKSVQRTPLPPFNGPEEVRTEKWDEQNDPLLPEDEAAVEARISFERDPQNRIVVPSELENIHPVVARTVEAMKGVEPDDCGMLEPQVAACLSMRISRASLDRATRIMDTLIRAIEFRGFRISVDEEDTHTSCAEILGERLPMILAESTDRLERELTEKQKKEKLKNPWRYQDPEYDHVPSGLLMLAINCDHPRQIRKTWRDTEKQRVEDRLNAVVVSLVRIAAQWRADRAASERRRREREEQERLRIERERRQREEQERRKRLEQEVESWHRARRIRVYVRAVRRGFEGDPGNVERVNRWVSWATKVAEAMDPITNGECAARRDLERPTNEHER